MNRLFQFIAWAILAPFLLGACAATAVPDAATPTLAEPTDGGLRPIALRLSVTGATQVMHRGADPIPVELTRAGTEAPVALILENAALSTHTVPPGHYSITRIGPLTCTGISFDLEPGAGLRALGTLSAEIIQTDYDIALISAKPASPVDLASLDAADAAPLTVHRQALCHAGRGGQGTTYQDLSTGEQIMLGIVFAGFCAIALAGGGFCAF
jgi:hypothetical protein